MTKARPRFELVPRGLTNNEVAHYLGLSATKFSAIKPKLLARGFPTPDPDTGRTDLKAVDSWWDTQSSLVSISGARVDPRKALEGANVD